MMTTDLSCFLPPPLVSALSLLVRRPFVSARPVLLCGRQQSREQWSAAAEKQRSRERTRKERTETNDNAQKGVSVGIG